MRNNKSGVSLIEILIATAIIVFAAAAILQFFVSSSRLASINKEETVVMSHLANMLEAIKCTPFSNLITSFPNGVSDGPSANNYATLIGGYALANEHIIVSYVNPSSDPLEIIVRVDWQDMRAVTRSKYLVTKRTR